MSGKRRSIKDVDNDLAEIKDSLAALADAVLNKPEPVNEPDVEPEAEFFEPPQDEPEEAYEADRLPSVELKPFIAEWYRKVAGAFGHTVEHELRIILTKYYYANRASQQAEESRHSTLSGETR